MKWNFVKDEHKEYNMYSNKKCRDKKIVTIIILVIILVISLLLIGFYSIDNIIKLKKIEKYSKQLVELVEQLKEEEKREKELQERRKQEILAENKDNIVHIYRSETKRVFLTFDDGPSNNTTMILDILQNYGIKASFFVLGSRVEIMPEKVKEINVRGHFIANHGYSHIYEKIYSSPQAVLEEYNKTNELIQEATGNPEFNSHLFRFPGGLAGGKYAEIKKQAKELLEENQIWSVDWNALTGDSETNNPTIERLMCNLQKTADGKKSVVLLMHDSAAKKATADSLPQVIEYFKQQGYEFKTFYDVLK